MTDGLIEYAIPEKPNSRLQEYRLTERGRSRLGATRGRITLTSDRCAASVDWNNHFGRWLVGNMPREVEVPERRKGGREISFMEERAGAPMPARLTARLAGTTVRPNHLVGEGAVTERCFMDVLRTKPVHRQQWQEGE